MPAFVPLVFRLYSARIPLVLRYWCGGLIGSIGRALALPFVALPP